MVCQVHRKSFFKRNNALPGHVAHTMATTICGKMVSSHPGMSLTDQVLFVSSKVGFTIEYLKYHEELLFRGQVATRATAYAYNAVFSEHFGHVEHWFRQLHETALFYYLALKELEQIGLHMEIEIDNELSDSAVDLYHAFCRLTLFPPSHRGKVNIFVGDGHAQVRCKCPNGPLKRTGRPRKNPRNAGKHSNRWFAVCDPDTGRILCLKSMHEPEGMRWQWKLSRTSCGCIRR